MSRPGLLSKAREVLFWGHLALGVAAGAIIFVMSVTGAVLVFEDPLVAWAEADAERPAPSTAPRMSLVALAAKAGETFPGASLATVTVRAKDGEAVTFGFGRGKSVSLDPRTGKALKTGSKTHDAFHKIEDFHRWIGSRELGKPVTGASNAAFLLLVLGGPFLWWPRNRKKGAFAAISVPDLSLTGKARDFNWHNAFGLWSAPVLLVVTFSGLLISYPDASALFVKVLGADAPVSAPPRPATKPGAPDLDAAAAVAASLIPGWESITVRLPAKPGAPLGVTAQEPSSYPPAPRSQLSLDAATGEILKWEPYAAAGRGRRWRSLFRYLHTGEALGVPGQIAAGLASAVGALLVWTGLALAWRRWSAWRR